MSFETKKFLITYNDAENECIEEVVMEFTDTETTTAREWAEDYAYALADKGWYRAKELK